MKLSHGIYGGTVIPQDRDGFVAVTQFKPKFGVAHENDRDKPWWVVRYRDARVMTSGGVATCAQWIAVWGPMHMASE